MRAVALLSRDFAARDGHHRPDYGGRGGRAKPLSHPVNEEDGGAVPMLARYARAVCTVDVEAHAFDIQVPRFHPLNVDVVDFGNHDRVARAVADVTHRDRSAARKGRTRPCDRDVARQCGSVTVVMGGTA
jgi:hypothetical protein